MTDTFILLMMVFEGYAATLSEASQKTNAGNWRWDVGMDYRLFFTDFVV